MQNSNFQQEDVSSTDYLSELQFKNNPSQKKENSNRNSQQRKSSNQKEQITPKQLQNKKENQTVAQIEQQENVSNQFYISKQQQEQTPSQEKKQIIQPYVTQIEKQQQQTHSQINRKSQLKIQPVFCVKIQIIQYNHNEKIDEQIFTPQNTAQQIQNKKKKEQNELKPQQLIQSNIFQSQGRDGSNKRSTNQRRVSEQNQENSEKSLHSQKLSTYEVRMGVQEDPMLKEKQDILSDIYEILKQFSIKSSNKRHSILEDMFQLCLLYLPEIRQSQHQLHSQSYYEEAKIQYKLDRNYQAFKRRFYHLQLFSDCWTVQNLLKIYQVIKNSQEIQLNSYHLIYNIVNKSIDFPEQIQKKKSPEKPKVVQEIIKNSQNKKVVLRLTTKTLCQYVNLSAKEIDEDIQEFDDELKFIDMILKLIPLAL